jgi:hypothetical protein
MGEALSQVGRPETALDAPMRARQALDEDGLEDILRSRIEPRHHVERAYMKQLMLTEIRSLSR